MEENVDPVKSADVPDVQDLSAGTMPAVTRFARRLFGLGARQEKRSRDSMRESITAVRIGSGSGPSVALLVRIDDDRIGASSEPIHPLNQGCRRGCPRKPRGGIQIGVEVAQVCDDRNTATSSGEQGGHRGDC
ncbi:MAG TPA: hypothetical protein VGB64_03865 [Actinomycetota bacterium]